MAITKEQKKGLVGQYMEDIKSAVNVVIRQQKGIDVNTITEIRKELAKCGGVINVIRKRLFLRAIKESGYQDTTEGLEGSVVVLYSFSDDTSPLKVINKVAKTLKGDKVTIKFLGGWYDKERKDGQYVTEIANVPSKEELLSKFVYLLNYPVQSFACVLDQIAKKSS